MNDDDVFAAITRHRVRVADELETLSGAEWDLPSWCDGWRVRDVLGHLVSILDTPMWKVMTGIAAAGGFDRWTSKTARRFGEQEPATLVAEYRRLAPRRFRPPGSGPEAPLTDIVVHGFDSLAPTGRRVEVEPEAVDVVLAYLASKRARIFVPPARLAGLRFEASDGGFRHGTGPVVHGPGSSLALVMTGRRGGLEGLEGEGVATLRSRIGG